MPTSGRFYLHDDRTADKGADEDEDAEPEEPLKDGGARRRAAASEGGDRWKHDRFEPDRQQARQFRASLWVVYAAHTTGSC